jgi:hypothetical protein
LKVRSHPTHFYLNRSLKPLKGEIWKAIEGYEDLYEISNFGRVKALPKFREIVIPKRGTIRYWTKELIRKQSLARSLNTHLHEHTYCLTVSLYRDGNFLTYTVPRLVYAHFGKDVLTKDALVLHKDNDTLHNHIDNLYKAGHTQMHLIAYKRKRKESHFTELKPSIRKSYTRKAIEANKKPITQYTINGKRIKIYDSLIAASKETGVNDASISNAVAGRYLTAGGYVWFLGKGKPFIDTKKLKEKILSQHQHSCKRIRQYSAAGKLIAEFPSITMAAASVNGSARQLSDAVHGRSKTAYGFKWRLVC